MLRADREARVAARAEEPPIAPTLYFLCGAICIAVGAWFLLLAPGIESEVGGQVVNLQRLAIGQTAMVVGVLLVMAGSILRALAKLVPPVSASQQEDVGLEGVGR